ncbi:MAG: pyrimidine 5'-nucleotidase [Anaerolineales bacterium]|nr:pyrimidine 5'-nucleotidase [Anaerolineales bacterium]
MDFTTLFLDLDDTLYPHTSGLWEAVGSRIQTYIEKKLNVSAEDASHLRAQYLAQFGTTLNGLIHHHQIDPMEYLDYVHDVPVENLIPPDPELQTMLASITIPRVIFTNAHLEYAERVLNQLGISDLVTQIIDILALDFSNKPNPEAYHRALILAGNPSSDTCLLVDDRFPNLSTAADFGMTTVLVGDGIIEGTVDYTIEHIHDLTNAVPCLVKA